jgi:hypothetical protein
VLGCDFSEKRLRAPLVHDTCARFLPQTCKVWLAKCCNAAGIVNTKLIDEEMAKQVWNKRPSAFLMGTALCPLSIHTLS